MNNTTATTGFGHTSITVDDLREAQEKLAAIPKNNQWILVDPQGRMCLNVCRVIAAGKKADAIREWNRFRKQTPNVELSSRPHHETEKER